MKKQLLALVLALGVSGTVWAACSFNSVIVGGRVVTCVTCCDDTGQNCVTQCS